MEKSSRPKMGHTNTLHTHSIHSPISNVPWTLHQHNTNKLHGHHPTHHIHHDTNTNIHRHLGHRLLKTQISPKCLDRNPNWSDSRLLNDLQHKNLKRGVKKIN